MTTVYTIGHSTRRLEALVGLFRAHGITRLVDVRRFPRSRRNPQFNRESLLGALATVGISYTAAPGLGGRRPARRDSINAGWHNTGFRGYADYMQTPAFAGHLDALVAQASTDRVAVMCAEAVPWRCHRSLIADALVAGGVGVEHILSEERAEPHRMTVFARVDGRRVTYPGETLDLPLDHS